MRRANLLTVPHRTINDLQVNSYGLPECLARVEEASRWAERRGRLPRGHGLGMACSHYASGAAKRKPRDSIPTTRAIRCPYCMGHCEMNWEVAGLTRDEIAEPGLDPRDGLLQPVESLPTGGEVVAIRLEVSLNVARPHAEDYPPVAQVVDRRGHVGQEVGVSDWLEITQDRVNQCVSATR